MSWEVEPPDRQWKPCVGVHGGLDENTDETQIQTDGTDTVTPSFRIDPLDAECVQLTGEISLTPH